MDDSNLRLASLVFASIACATAFGACTSDPYSPPLTSSDAGAGDASIAADSSSVEDAAPGTADASDATDATSAPDADSAADAPVDVVDASAAIHADVTADFATVTNPNGAWTYGYSLGDPTAADAGAIVVYSAVTSDNPQARGWYDPSNVVLGAPSAWRNDSAAPINGVAAGEFAMHPGQAGEYAIARWTAPAAGSYDVIVQFKTGDTGDTNGLLLHNGVALVTEDSTSTDAVHTLAVTLGAGDHLDIAVGNKGDFYYDTTPVHFTIQSGGIDP